MNPNQSFYRKIDRKAEEMSRLRKMFKNRIASTRGMSLGETLAAVLIMLLATSVLTSTVSLGVSQYLKTLSRSEANILSSTLQSVITDELAYTTEITLDGSNLKRFQSQNYVSADSENRLSPVFTVSASDGGDYGYVMVGDQKLLGDGSYPNGIGVKINGITYNKDTHIFTVSFEIGRNGEKILEQTFQIINVNNVEPG